MTAIYQTKVEALKRLMSGVVQLVLVGLKKLEMKVKHLLVLTNSVHILQKDFLVAQLDQKDLFEAIVSAVRFVSVVVLA